MSDVDRSARAPVEAFLAEGVRALETGDLARAETAYRTVIERRPDRAEGHLGMATVLLHAGRPADALTCLPAAVEADPASFEAYELFAFIGIHGGVADTAITWLEHGAQFLPREPRLFEYLVRLYAAENRADDLRQCLVHYGRLRGFGLRQAALVFTRDAGLADDLKSRIAIAAGF